LSVFVARIISFLGSLRKRESMVIMQLWFWLSFTQYLWLNTT